MGNGFKLAGAALITAGTIAGGAMTGLPMAQASVSVSPAQRTCAAEAAWVRHHTTANLNAMVVASLGAPYKYVGEDAIGLYKDVRRGSAASYISKDLAYFAKDC